MAANRGRLAARTRAVFAVNVHRKRRRIQQHSLPLRTPAGARRRRTRQAQYRSAARIYRRCAARASSSSCTLGYRSIPRSKSLTLSFSLQRMREWLGPDHPVVRKSAHQGFARHARDTARGRDEARRPRGTKAALGGRQSRRRRIAGSHDHARKIARRRTRGPSASSSRTKSKRRFRLRRSASRRNASRPMEPRSTPMPPSRCA